MIEKTDIRKKAEDKCPSTCLSDERNLLCQPVSTNAERQDHDRHLVA